ncbi:hypothetical protein BJ170DRAFT_609447 [Xylariales sp. AK1849]|nr:hypothetical protein BJ170DRAFT_609447 [Xylariales sp. AK1849]
MYSKYLDPVNSRVIICLTFLPCLYSPLSSLAANLQSNLHGVINPWFKSQSGPSRLALMLRDDKASENLFQESLHIMEPSTLGYP